MHIAPQPSRPPRRTARRPHNAAVLAAAGALLTSTAIACHRSHSQGASPGSNVAQITLSSSSFQGARIPSTFTCDGASSSPQLAWTAPPAATKGFVLIVTDPDAPLGTFVHWVLYDIPAGMRELSAGLPNAEQFPDGSRQGRNNFGKIGYGAPCPPRGSTHRYFFDLFALDSRLNLPAGATRSEVEDAMNTHVLARGKLLGRYGR